MNDTDFNQVLSDLNEALNKTSLNQTPSKSMNFSHDDSKSIIKLEENIKKNFDSFKKEFNQKFQPNDPNILSNLSKQFKKYKSIKLINDKNNNLNCSKEDVTQCSKGIAIKKAVKYVFDSVLF